MSIELADTSWHRLTTLAWCLKLAVCHSMPATPLAWCLELADTSWHRLTTLAWCLCRCGRSSWWWARTRCRAPTLVCGRDRCSGEAVLLGCPWQSDSDHSSQGEPPGGVIVNKLWGVVISRGWGYQQSRNSTHKVTLIVRVGILLHLFAFL